MKKIVLSIATVMVTAAFAPQASAVPVFARQTGMACSACHFQHFPQLNSFGRAFKAGGFTMMGAQARIEDEREKEKTLSLPANLNIGVLASMGYIKDNQRPDPSGSTKNVGNGYFAFPGSNGGGGDSEASLFIGGRVSEFAGFLTEINLAPPAGLGSAKTPILFDVSGSRVGFVPFTTNDQGASYGMETLNTGANAIHSMSNTVGPNAEFISALSAQQYIGTATPATGMAFVGTNEKGFFNLTKFNQSSIANAASASLGSTYMRLVATFDVDGWDTGVGIQSWRGTSLVTDNPTTVSTLTGYDTTVGRNTPIYTTSTVLTPQMQQTKATAIDGQIQGQIGEMPLGVYASYARAPASDGITPNSYNRDILGNPGTLTRSSFNIGAELGVLPGIATLGVAVRRGKSGQDQGTLSGTAPNGVNASDNAFYLTATYKLQQNMLARLSYVSQSGSYWFSNAAGTGTTDQFGSKTTMMNMYVLF